MANPSKKKGTAAETKVLKYFESKGMAVRRLPLSGNKDKGDLEIDGIDGSTYTVEVKTGKMTENPSRSQLEDWIGQAIEESKNAQTSDWILVIARYRRKLDDADVWYCSEEGDICHLYLDQIMILPPQ